MALALLALLAVALCLAWWVARRATRYRREAESREARVLEALFVSRHSADGGASIDVDQVFGVAPATAAPTSADAVLRAVELQAEVAALLNKPLAERSVVEMATAEMAAGRRNEKVDRAAAARPAAHDATALTDTAEAPLEAPAPVRDLVQVFYEARGFRAGSADPSARPIELVLAHKSDAQRAYAFAPLAEPPSAAALQSIIERARRIDQKRVLIAVEDATASDLGGELPAHGVRVLDRPAIEAQLARLDAGIAEKIRTTAWRRAGQRLKSG